MCLEKKYLWQNIVLKKRMLPFGDFLPLKKKTSTQHNWQMIFWNFWLSLSIVIQMAIDPLHIQGLKKTKIIRGPS
jgi:hypothetical protein